MHFARKADIKLESGDRLFSTDIDTYWKEQDKHRRRLHAVEIKPQQILEYSECYITQYLDVFSEEEFDQLPPRQAQWCKDLHQEGHPMGYNNVCMKDGDSGRQHSG